LSAGFASLIPGAAPRLCSDQWTRVRDCCQKRQLQLIHRHLVARKRQIIVYYSLRLGGPNVTTEESFYAKFRIDNGPLKAMDAFIISENEDRVHEWKADERPLSDPTASTEPVAVNRFEELARSFDKSINIFQNTVPFLMQMIPLFLQLMDDRSIRRFTRRHAACLETGNLRHIL
jgi:hypothetical protein